MTDFSSSSACASDPRGIRVFSAPGRVNLIGEHTDYTGGLVLPMAIPFATTAEVSPAVDGRYSFSSDGFASTRQMGVDDRAGKAGEWSDYPVGVLRELQKLGIEPPPFALHLHGDVPLGSGLSSSASVEVATAMALLAHAQATLATEKIALLCQRAENLYVESPCGIMDQFASAAAEAGHALLLHTRTLAYGLLPMNGGALANTRVVVVNSNVKHSIGGGEYGSRRTQLEAGQTIVCRRFPEVFDLGEANLDQLNACRPEMSAESFRRCRHVISENTRVQEARSAMLAGDPAALGSAMHGSHVSQRDDFQCSIAEIDFLVETAMATRGCFGARLTGGGFGGCTVNLVATEQAGAFGDSLRKAYRERYGIEAPVYVCEAVDGAVRRAEVKA